MPLMNDQLGEESLSQALPTKKYNFVKVNPTPEELDQEDQLIGNLNEPSDEKIDSPQTTPAKKYNFVKVNPTLEDLNDEEESYLGTVGRNLVRGGARAAESVLGFPGDLYQTGKSLVGGIGRLAEKAIPKPIKEAASGVKKGLESYLPEGTSLTDISKRAIPGMSTIESVAESLPTAESLKEKTIQAGKAIGLPDKYLEAQTPGEESTDSYVRDVANFIMPGAGKLKSVAALGRAIKGAGLFATVPNLVSYANKKITGNETLGEGLKLGTMLAQSLYGIKPVDLENFGNGLSNKAQSALKGNPKIKSNNVLNAVRKIENNYVKSGHENMTAKKQVGDFLNSVYKKGITPGKPAKYSKPNSGRILDEYGKQFIEEKKLLSPAKLPVEEMSIRDMWALKKDIWPTLREIKGKDKTAEKLMKSLGATLDKTLKNTPNKKFNQLYKEGNAVLTAFHNMEDVLDYTKEILGGKEANLAKAYSFITQPFKTFKNVLLANGLATTYTKPKEAKILLDVFKKSPELKRAYAGIFQSAAKRNSTALIKQAMLFKDALTKEAEDYAKKEKKRIRR